MRVEPDIALGEPYELASRVVQERRAAIVDHRPVDRDPRSYLDRRWRGGVGNPRFVVDVVDPEFDSVFDAAGLDDCHAHRLGIAALALAIEHVAHRQDRLERVPLRAAGRRHVSLAARHPDRVVQDGLDRAGLDAAGVVLDDDRSGLDGDRDHRGDLGLLTGIERVVDQLLEHHEGPLRDAVPGLVLQFPPGAELHQPRDPEGDAG